MTRGVQPASPPPASMPAVPRNHAGQFLPGVGGNPNGRPRAQWDLPAMCRERTPKAVQVLTELLDDEDGRLRYMAAKELLDRGWGRAPQPVVDQTSPQSLGVLHLLAAQHVQAILEKAQQPGQTVEAVLTDFSQPALE
jgi:hypothetical protein